MTYQETLRQEINTLPPALLSEVLKFVLLLKNKTFTPAEATDIDLQFQQELRELSQA